MQKNKTKRDNQTNTEDDQTYQNRSRSTIKEINSKNSNELNNNYINMNKSENTAPLASCTEIDHTQEMTEPKTKVIHKHTDTESGDLTLNATEGNNCATSNASETSLSSFLPDINRKKAPLRRKVRRTQKLKSKPQKKLLVSESTEINNDPGFDADESSATEIQTDSISQISKPKAKSTCKPRGRRPKKLIKSKETVKDDNPTDSRLEAISTPDRVKPEEKVTCNNKDCTNKDISLVTDVQIDLMSRNLIPKGKYARKSRGKPTKKPIKSEEITVQDKAPFTTEDTLSNSWLDIVPTSEMKKKIEPTEMNNYPESKIADTPSAITAQIDSTSKPRAKFVCKKTRGRKSKQITKSKAMIVKDNPIFESTVISSDSRLQMESTSEKVKPKNSKRKSSRGAQWKKIVGSESTELNYNPEWESQDTPIVTEIQTDITAEISKPNAKCEGKGKKSGKLMTSDLMEMNITPECDNKDIYLATQIQAHSISKTPRPKTKRTRKSRAKKIEMIVKSEQMLVTDINSKSEIIDRCLTTEVETDLKLETAKPKPKPKFTRKSKAKESKVLINPNAIETCSVVNQTEDTPTLDNYSVNTPVPMSKELEVSPTTKRLRAGTPNKSKKLKKVQINNNPASSQTDSLSETLKVDDHPNYNSEEKSQETQPRTDYIAVDTIGRIGNDHTDITDNLSSKNDNSLIPKRIETKYPLLDKIYQPKVLLSNIAYSDILSPNQRKRLLRNEESGKPHSLKKRSKSLNHKSHTLKDVTDSSTDQSIKLSTSSNIINELSPEPEKRNGDKPVKCLSSNATCEDKHSMPKKQRVRTKKNMRTQSKLSELKSWDKTCKSELTVRNSEINSKSGNETDGLSSIGNEELNINKCSTSADSSLEQGSLAQPNHFGEKLTESSNVQTEEQILMSPLKALPEMMELEIPLDLSIRNSDKSISIQSDSLKPNDSIEQISSETSEVQSQDINVHNTGFGNSTFNTTNLSTSFNEIDNGKLSENINICQDLTLQKYHVKDQTASLPTTPEFAEEIFPTASTASKYAEKHAKSKTTVPAKPKKLPSTDTVPIIVSLPAKHYFNKKNSTFKKSDTVKRKPTSKKATTKSQATLNKTENKMSKSSTHSTSNKKPSKIKTTKSEKSTKGESNQYVGSPAPVPDICRLVEKKSYFHGPLRTCDTNYVRASDPILLGPIITKPIIMNVRSLPKIVSDQLLPKGTITLSSENSTESTVPCVFPVEVENKSYFEKNINQVEQNQEMHQLAIHKQSTYTSIENVSQSQPTAVDNLEEFENSHGLNVEEKVSKRLQTNDCTDQSSVADQNFDSTQLWKICPELEDYFSHDDIVNNNDNNEKKLSNFYDRNTTTKNTEIDNRLHTFSTKVETKTNVDNSKDLQSNNIMYISENANNLHDIFKDVVAVNVDYNEMEVESSESIASYDESNSHNESKSRKCSVIANLTVVNLRNFNNTSNHNVKSGLNWSAETCQYYSSHGELGRHDDKLVPNIAVEKSCGATESTSESQKTFSPIESKKRKRKWLEEEKNTSFKPAKKKRLKLNRNRWCLEGQDFENSTNSPRPISVIESINSDNTVTSNVVEKKSSYQEIDKEKITIKHQSQVAAEITEASQDKNDNKPEQFDEKIVDSTETNESKNIETLTTIPVDTENSKTSPCDFGNDSRLKGELHVTPSQHIKDNDSNSSIDRNGNLRSTNSSSCSSSSESSKPISNHEGSTDSESSEKNRPEQSVPEPCEKRCVRKENKEEEVDEDCISLFAESLFTNFDPPTNLDGASQSLLYKLRTKEPEEKFRDMTDVGAYFDRNIQECNEAYEYCAQKDERMHNTSQDVPDAFGNESHVKLIPELLEMNLSRPYFSQSTQISERDVCPSTSVFQKPNLSSITNLDKHCEKGGTTKAFSTYAEGIFDWHCYPKLRQGICNRLKCRFFHHLTPNLQNLDQKSPDVIIEVINYAISRGYNYFIKYIYPKVVWRLDYINIMRIFHKLYNVDLMDEYRVESTIDVVTKIGIPLRIFLSDYASFCNENNNTISDSILRTVSNMIELGSYWDTCRDLLIRMKPSTVSILPVLYGCILTKDKLQIRDVYMNYARRLTPDQVSSININLRRQFNIILLENDLFDEPERSNQPALFDNVNPQAKFLEMNVADDNCKGKSHIPTILSPDDTAHQNHENLLPISCSSSSSFGSKQISQKFSPQESLTKNKDNGSNSTTSNHSFLQQRRSTNSTQVSAEANQQSPDFNATTIGPGVANSSSRSFTLHQIENLQPPRSAFRDRHWKIHLDVNNLEEALKHSEYPLALNILDKYSQMDETVFTTSCYRMLRQNVAASTHHVKNIIKLSVRIEVNKFLNETLVNLGMYMMIELCNSNAWVLAYTLFKSLQYSATLTESNATFSLIAAEICLANRRPLKAFIILKQNNMLCTNRNKWNVVSEPNDEHVSVMIINLLLDVLCQEYPDRAFYIFTHLVKDQTRIYHPVDLTAHIDKLVTSLLNGKYNDSIYDVGRLIIENNFTLKTSVFQSLIVNIYQNDIALCKQLYRYGTWLGVYPIVKLTLPLHIFIKTNWTEEEMYLVIVDFLEKLLMDIGLAVGRIGPNEFTIHLVFELAPFKQQLPENNLQISNKDELKVSKELMKSVLQERFDPPLRTIIAEKERFVKLQSSSVVNYLKSMIVEK